MLPRSPSSFPQRLGLAAGIAAILLTTGGCFGDDLLPGPWDSNLIYRCMNRQNLGEAEMRDSLLGVWFADYTQLVARDSVYSPIVTLEFCADSTLLVIRDDVRRRDTVRYEVVRTGRLDEPAGAHFRLAYTPSVATLVARFMQCDGRLYFHESTLLADSKSTYGFVRAR